MFYKASIWKCPVLKKKKRQLTQFCLQGHIFLIQWKAWSPLYALPKLPSPTKKDSVVCWVKWERCTKASWKKKGTFLFVILISSYRDCSVGALAMEHVEHFRERSEKGFEPWLTCSRSGASFRLHAFVNRCENNTHSSLLKPMLAGFSVICSQMPSQLI